MERRSASTAYDGTAYAGGNSNRRRLCRRPRGGARPIHGAGARARSRRTDSGAHARGQVPTPSRHAPTTPSRPGVTDAAARRQAAACSRSPRSPSRTTRRARPTGILSTLRGRSLSRGSLWVPVRLDDAATKAGLLLGTRPVGVHRSRAGGRPGAHDTEARRVGSGRASAFVFSADGFLRTWSGTSSGRCSRSTEDDRAGADRRA